MYLRTILAKLSLLASIVSAAPLQLLSRQAPGAQNVVYWGQNGGGTIENNDLSTYCTSQSGIDIIVLAFLYEFGNGNTIASGTIGQSCYISPAGEPQQCDALATAIETCKANGVKVMISLGGAASAWSLLSAAEAQTIGQNLWEAYGNTAAGSTPRPFGSTFVDGFDFDLESNSGNEYFQYMISTLRSNFASDPGNTYYITGAPQCPIPEPNMGEIISAAQFDYLWVQFYNNNPVCSLGFNGNAAFNFDAWVSFIATTPSAGAKIFIGAPAAPLAANGGVSGEVYYIPPTDLATLVNEYKSNAAFGGVMLWAAGFSDSNIIDGCTFAQEVHEILLTGSPASSCSGTGTLTTTVTSTPTPTTSPTGTSPPTTTVTGTVGAYDQVSPF
ncbi:endochitinase 2 [Coleophoma crateriformis]|uniref:chitinase n=1 Tax=Coleophoma crateriformis TaxID=565419 RepID=A0A3D8SZR5_9HELO|nr:endochitinase 2 [Coleophoma crateriformis]